MRRRLMRRRLMRRRLLRRRLLLAGLLGNGSLRRRMALIGASLPGRRGPFLVVSPVRASLLVREALTLRPVLVAGKCSAGVHQREPERDDEHGDPNQSPISGRTWLRKVHRFSLRGWLAEAIRGPDCIHGYPGPVTTEPANADVSGRNLPKNSPLCDEIGHSARVSDCFQLIQLSSRTRPPAGRSPGPGPRAARAPREPAERPSERPAARGLRRPSRQRSG